MNAEKNILEIVKESNKILDKSFPVDLKSSKTENIYDNIITMIRCVQRQYTRVALTRMVVLLELSARSRFVSALREQ